jgi:hypothetical protein
MAMRRRQPCQHSVRGLLVSVLVIILSFAACKNLVELESKSWKAMMAANKAKSRYTIHGYVRAPNINSPVSAKVFQTISRNLLQFSDGIRVYVDSRIAANSNITNNRPNVNIIRSTPVRHTDVLADMHAHCTEQLTVGKQSMVFYIDATTDTVDINGTFEISMTSPVSVIASMFRMVIGFPSICARAILEGFVICGIEVAETAYR